MRISESLTEQNHRPHLIPESHDYFRHNECPLFWLLMPYFRNQENDSFCSVASATMVTNAIKAEWLQSDVVSPLSQHEVLALAQDDEWKKSVSPTGKGATLALLKNVLITIFRKLGLGAVSVEAVSVDDTEACRNEFTALLKELGGSTDVFVIANFALGLIASDEKVGHFAPLAAFDKKSDEVLILDPDTEFHQPYWAPRARLFEAMLEEDEETNRPRGYLVIRRLDRGA